MKKRLLFLGVSAILLLVIMGGCFFMAGITHAGQDTVIVTEYIDRYIDRVEYIDRFIETKIERVDLEYIFVDRPILIKATEEELDRAFKAMEYGRHSHNIRLLDSDYPGNGGTAYEQEWVDNYDLFKELIERAYVR